MAKIKTFFNQHKALLLGIFLAALVLCPLVLTGMQLRVMTTILIYSILCIGSMIIMGYAGMLNMGMSAFYGVGAYTSALLATKGNMPYIVCFLAAGVFTAICGFLIAFPCLRVKVDFLSLITIAFSNIFVAVVTNWISLTGGSNGVTSIPKASFFGHRFSSREESYYLVLFVAVVIYILVHNMVNSKIGRTLQAVRDDEIGARSVGINVDRQKIFAFTVGTFIAGLAGSLMTQYIGFVGPSNFTFDESTLIVQMTVIGGLGTMPGAVFGAAFFTIIPEIFRPLAVYRLGVGGMVMTICMLFRPQGVLGSRAFAGDGGISAALRAFVTRANLKTGSKSE